MPGLILCPTAAYGSIPGLCGKGQYPHLLLCFVFKIKICFLMTITTYQLASV